MVFVRRKRFLLYIYMYFFNGLKENIKNYSHIYANLSSVQLEMHVGSEKSSLGIRLAVSHRYWLGTKYWVFFISYTNCMI